MGPWSPLSCAQGRLPVTPMCHLSLQHTPPSAEGTACAEGQPTCTTPMAITQVQNRKMPRGAAGKATIRENCSQEIREPGSTGLRAVAS